MPKTKKIKKDAVVLTARDMLNGYVANNYDQNIYNMTPLQMIPEEEKDEDWKKWNLDWLERAGLRQLSKESKKLVKNYHLANGILDKSDYIIGPENDMSDMISIIVADNESTLPIKFYSIIPNVINVLTGEFSKRDTRIIAQAVDEQSINEAYEYKMKLLTDILTQKAEQDKVKQLQEMGMDFEDPAQQEQIKQEIDSAKQIAEAEVKFKSYRGIAEQWANHILLLDNDRFSMYQLEGLGFRDMLIADREFWHIRVLEEDYDIELWNPIYTFYHKSPDVQYVAEGNFVGRIRTMSIPDIIDLYGSKMTEEQLLNLKNHYRILNNFPMVPDAMKDQENWYTNFSKPDGRTNVTWQKWLDAKASQSMGMDGGMPSNNNSAISWFDLNRAGGSTFDMDINGPGMVRVTEAYWKSQRRVGHLTYIKRDGTIVQEVVDEKYKITEKPVYDTSLSRAKTKDSLISGEHIDWIWINEVRWGVKLNSSLSTYYSRNYSDFEPIYISGDPIPFQFKGTNNIYGCKLPVEGKIFSERNSYSSSLVDKMKPNQVSFNVVNNQIMEMLADEVGNVMVIDQNMIPRNSINGQWGKYAFPQFYQVMKDYQVAAIDPSVRNTEGATNFAHFQSVDMSKTNQIVSRLKLGEYFKSECFAVVGITPQRLGDISASESATGTQQAVNNSYSQTEPYFDQHMNYLMPRVRQMMLEAAQFINANKPKSRVSYLNKDEENVFFDIEGDRLSLREFRVYAKSTANIKELMKKLENLAMQNMSAGGSLVDLAKMLTLQSPSEIISKLEEAEAKRSSDIQTQRDHEIQLEQQRAQNAQALEKQIEEHDDYWKEREIQKEIYIAEIKSLGYAKDNDINSNKIPDALEVDKFLHDQNMSTQDILLKEHDLSIKEQKLQLDSKKHSDQMNDKEKDRKSREKLEGMKLRNKVVGEK